VAIGLAELYTWKSPIKKIVLSDGASLIYIRHFLEARCLTGAEITCLQIHEKIEGFGAF